MKEKIMESIVSGVITTLISTVISLILVSLVGEKIGVFISDSKNVNGDYITFINLKNYQTVEMIEKLELYTENTIENVITDLNYDMYNEKIIIENIYPSYNGSIVLYTKEKIDKENMNIYCTSKVGIEWIGESKKFSKSISQTIVAYIITFLPMMIISNMIMAGLSSKSEKIIREEIRVWENREKYNVERINNIEKWTEEYKKENKYLTGMITHYSKELDFWKDTVRKAFCKDKSDLKTMADFFEFVTANLKTYKTLRKCDYSTLSSIISEQEEYNNGE